MMESYERFVGQTLGGRYRIEKQIGIGGMAVVFRAYDPVIQRYVAVKMLKEDVARDEAAVKRFINESKAVAMLSHPNIVSIYDVSVSGEYKYIVMEYIEGITLKSYMSQKGALPLDEVIHYSRQILSALAHAHGKGIIHRDIKPQNIMLLKDGKIKVTDFGIAKLPNAETVTMTDKAIGTVYYISPEQASGLAIDTRSDLYSMGVVMYEMASGKLPFVAETPVSVALMQVNSEPAPPTEINPSIPKGMEQIILTAMEKSADARFSTADQMLSRLNILKKNPGVIFKPLSETGAADKNKKGKKIFNSEKKKNERNERLYPSYLGSSMLPIILGVAFAFLIVCIICAYHLLANVFFNSEADKSYIMTVDNFVGQTYHEGLENELAQKDYTVFVEYVYDSDHEAGTIIEQSPVEGEKRRVESGKTTCELTLVVCRGTETFILPDCIMKDYRTVEDELFKKYGLTVTIEEEYNVAVTAGFVISTTPVAGTEVKSGDNIVLKVSKGGEISTVLVPQFVGMTEKEARLEVEKYSLKVGTVTYEYSDQPAGTIMNQSRIAFNTVVEGTSIDFIVSKGPEPKAVIPSDTDPVE